MDKFSLRACFLTLFFSGYSKKAPGTIGSLVALLLGLPILIFSANTLFLGAIFIGLIAIAQIDKEEEESKIHDSSYIVIDELVGMWLAMAISGLSLAGVVLSFIFFRIYDITKPSLIGRIDKEVKGGLGVVADDALAGVLAGLSALLVISILGFFNIKF
ncbi:phosphatidylglycerophosphatase A family protein [Helicobacter pylori]|uniref:phosphatidylglycerophosphatase A family protein n=1 Tax=Helicobacter pylori TaxID=210 RepID=UPI00025AC826|nr:phosphatidylglycerophosphatase A [Helicobacter pylori]EIE29894.1 phosphatidyl glycerophosphatase A [Helicobacter pylori NCTC 11637 = CCUG 17874 = ATCC 43504 = JCM 12093]MBM0602016.1 phosphatidylglycerophosphatase A [Helicobacter pylori]MBM0609405.1 phosphatidylglycerophosphatase A [Helicobacter pylori]MBM0618683.1 phosphatidylglycerophosphatase A [Helicobacter pylori]MBM0625869.1 phosphatidylglycerophosphatase A [Helicobacter pylori]